MAKIDNKSRNLKKILSTIVKGDRVQYMCPNSCHWVTINKINSGCALNWLHLEWRVRPDTFEEAFERFRGDKMPATLEEIAKYFWNAAIKTNKGNFND